jgi:DNA-binding transcriptional LysR family regulator
MAGLSSGALDVVISRLEAHEEDNWRQRFDISLLANEPYEIACDSGSTLRRRRDFSLAELRGHSWIVAPKETYTRSAFELAFLSQGLHPPIPSIESPSFHASIAIMNRCPTFLTFVPRSAVAYYTALGKVQGLALRTPFPEDRMVLAIRQDALEMEGVRALKDALLSAVQEDGSR